MTVVGAMPVWVHQVGNSLNAFEPFNRVGFEGAEGTRMEVCGPQAARELLTELVEHLAYHFVLTGDQVSPLLRVRTANRSDPLQYMVGGICTLEAGGIIYLPNLKGSVATWKNPLAVIRRLSAMLTRREPDDLPHGLTIFTQNPSEQLRSRWRPSMPRLLV